jgi:hypothetical protein
VHYEYDEPLADDESALRPFVDHQPAKIDGKRVGITLSESRLKLLHAANSGIIDDGAGRRAPKSIPSPQARGVWTMDSAVVNLSEDFLRE